MSEFRLAPGIAEFIARYLEVSGLSTATSVAQQRIDYADVVRIFRAPRPQDVASHDRSIEGRHGRIDLRHYRYRDEDGRARLLFIHGGGFILGDLDTHDDICAELCAATGCELVSVDYRLAPEYLHPVQLDDVDDAFAAEWRARTILVGVSAGATLAAALSYRRRTSARRAAGQVLIYPSLGGDCFDLESYRANATAPLLTTEDVLFYRGVRCADGEIPAGDPEFYPLLADAFDGTPPTVAISADVDPLRDDARLYAEKLEAAGVRAEWLNEDGLTHDFLRARHSCAAAAAAFTRICDAIDRLAAC